mgnify:CR=1 FL=1
MPLRVRKRAWLAGLSRLMPTTVSGAPSRGKAASTVVNSLAWQVQPGVSSLG